MHISFLDPKYIEARERHNVQVGFSIRAVVVGNYEYEVLRGHDAPSEKPEGFGKQRNHGVRYFIKHPCVWC